MGIQPSSFDWALPPADTERCTPRELTHVVFERSQIHGWAIAGSVIRSIVAHSDGSPHVAIKLLYACDRHRVADNNCIIIRTKHFERALEEMNS